MTNSKKGSKSSNKSIDEERKKARETKLQNERKVEED